MAWYDDEVVEDAAGGSAVIPHSQRPLAVSSTTSIAKPNTMRSIEDELHQEAGEVLQDVLQFADIDPENPVKPKGWSDKKFLRAKTGWSPAKDAPIAVKVAKDVLVGMSKARAAEKSGPKTMNMVVFYSGKAPDFPEQDVDR